MPYNLRSEKTCEHCQATYRPTSNRQRYCQTCAPSKSARARILRYGISGEQVTSLDQKQGGKCALCGSADWQCVDHDHETGAVRGLLCRTCNMALAFFEDDEWQERAEKYLNSE